ncbi:MAG: glycosyltransferase family 4 protein [Colwellia sp.]
MKVVLITPFYRPDNYGGAVQVYENLCREQGFEIHIICPDSQRYMNDEEYYSDTCIKLHRCESLTFEFTVKNKILRIKEFFKYYRNRKKDIIELLKEIEPNVILNGGVRWLGWMNHEFRKIAPVINYIHGEELSIRPIGLIGKWFFSTQNKSLSNVALNLCVSSYTSNKVLEISPKANTSVLTNFVDPNRYYPCEDKQTLKSKYGLKDKVSLVSVCRLIERKGIDDLLDALSEIISESENTVDIVLNVCGAGPDLERLKRRSVYLGLSGRVTFRGFTDDAVMLELLQASDIFVMPNKTVDGDLEGFGLVFLEANACGLPVIGGRSGGVVDAIEDGVSGYLVDPGDNKQLQQILKRLIYDDGLRSKLGQQGRKRAISEFSLSKKRIQFNEIINIGRLG